MYAQGGGFPHRSPQSQSRNASSTRTCVIPKGVLDPLPKQCQMDIIYARSEGLGKKKEQKEKTSQVRSVYDGCIIVQVAASQLTSSKL